MELRLRYTLVCDGSSDAALMPILTKTLQTHGVACAIQPALAETWSLPRSDPSLSSRIRLGVELYPCDLLFVHRDAEKQDPRKRKQEIARAVHEALQVSSAVPAVCVVPVRMQEAWLLTCESALRQAAGNRTGRQPLALPQLSDLESLPHPEKLLHALLREASGLGARRQRRLSVHACAVRVADYMDDLGPLRQLRAYRMLEEDVDLALSGLQWATEVQHDQHQ
ncbi:MAG: DUF4276 family protein [Anaerolineales bacterium]|nr:DUF4276 family protein [Anaerolineales bacterium]